jgi:hypothetical protein
MSAMPYSALAGTAWDTDKAMTFGMRLLTWPRGEQQRQDRPLVQHRGHELSGNVTFDQAFAVFGEHRYTPIPRHSATPGNPTDKKLYYSLSEIVNLCILGPMPGFFTLDVYHESILTK